MTKTLTEKWKDGKLPENTYYVQFIRGRYGVYEFEQFKGFGFDNDLAYIKEVLAPVPSYEEYKELQEQVNKQGIWHTDISFRKLEAENKRLKEQLKEAQNLIIYTAKGHDHLFAEIQCEDYMHKHHLPKWGVK